MSEQFRCIRWILGDQLNEQHSWFEQTDADVLYVIAELPQETGYTKHHVQKLCAFFAAMEQFAERLKDLGHKVLHLSLDETSGFSTLPDLMTELCDRYSTTELHYQRPDEYRLLKQLQDFAADSDLKVKEHDTEHLLLPFTEIGEHFEKGQHVRMESFYRKMRRRLKILMDGDQPVGGQWNFDKDNRNKLKQADLDTIPEPLLFSTDVSEIIQRLDKHEVDYFGRVSDPLPWPVTRADALTLLDFFCETCLPNFGRFQDALTGKSEHAWSLYHSRLSFAINAKLLDPKEVIETAISSYQQSDETDIAQIEGFVRQILGWREFVRGIYWANMPEYQKLNHYEANRDLPGFFWNGETKMRCLSQAINHSLDHAYAHHIQRLMITGNFALLTGIDPDQVDQWYLGIYIDAIEWVELPNTRGMALFGDGGIVGTKPYAAGGNYINKMSDYCGDCHYNVKEKVGDKACPLNSLYWHFMQKHRDELEKNQRLRMIYGSWDRMDEDTQDAILKQAGHYLKAMQ